MRDSLGNYVQPEWSQQDDNKITLHAILLIVLTYVSVDNG